MVNVFHSKIIYEVLSALGTVLGTHSQEVGKEGEVEIWYQDE